MCVAILKSAAIFVQEHFCVILIPIIFGVFVIFWVTLWAVVLAFLWSIGEYSKDENLPLAEVKWQDTTKYAIWVWILALFWLSCFQIYWGQFSIILSSEIWYFNQGGESRHPAPIKTGLYWTTRYHLGSIAFGALIIAIFLIIKQIFYYLKVKFFFNKNSGKLKKLVGNKLKNLKLLNVL